jgi:hypothetical protein
MQAQQVLHKLLMNTCPTMHKTRRESLAANVLGALTGRRLTVTDIGRSIQSGTSHKHNIKRADRLLSNAHLHQESMEVSRSLCRLLIGAQARPVLLVDWSDMDEYKQHFVLRAALVAEGRALTLYEEVHTLETKEKCVTHRQFLVRLKCLLPAHCCPIVVTDAGFRTTWFQLVEAMDWDWVGRVRNRHYVRWLSGGRWFDAKRCYLWATSRPKHLGTGVLTVRNQLRCQLVIYQGQLKGRKHKNRLGEIATNAYSRKKAESQREPWLLATSLPPSSTLAKQAVKLYQRRMQVEEGFRDIKSHRFGLGLNYHRTSSATRLQMLLLIANLALIVLWLIGLATVHRGLHYQFQANSTRHKRVLSLMFIGLQMMHDTRIQLTQDDINVAWCQLIELLHKQQGCP